MDGSAQLCAAGVFARLPLSTVGLGIVLMVSQTSGRYDLAATACGAYLLCAALAGPVWGNICDRRGQQWVLTVTAVLFTAGITAVIVDIGVLHSQWGLLLGATITGSAMPSIGAMVRSRWTVLQTDPELVAVAYSVEAGVDEILFIGGPALVGILTAVYWPAGVISVLVIALLGMLWLSMQSGNEPPAAATGRPLRAIRQPGMPIWFTIAFAIGGVLGAIDVIIVAIAPNRFVGPLALAVWAASSAAGGLCYALWSPRVTARRLVSGTLAILVTTLLLLVAGGFVQIVCVLAVSGAAFAPTMAVLNAVAEQNCQRSNLTETLAWISSGTAAGAAAGTVGGGHGVGAFAGQSVFLVPAAFAVLAAVTAILGHSLNSRLEATDFSIR
ncbi:MFS transporter [Nocardia sp. NPDC050193]